MDANREPVTEQQARIDATEPVERLLRDLRASRDGLSTREARRRLIVYGPNALQRRGRRRLWREFVRQLTHPLALLLWAAAGLAWVAGIVEVAIAILVVILLNAVFAFVQERQAERAVEALQEFLPPRSVVLRDRTRQTIDVRAIVPGDVIVIEAGDAISADARLLSGTIEVDTSMLTGESTPVARSADWLEPSGSLLDARDLVFSGTACTEGEGLALVVATGMHTELGRIAALSERVESDESPLEHQVRRVAWLIAAVAVALAIAFLPLATLGAGLSFSEAVTFSVGLIAGLVPEGLLPVITLALALGARELVRRGAVVKRLSAVETLGSTDVICTDKTGTLTENRMHVVKIWTVDGERDPGGDAGGRDAPVLPGLTRVLAACNNAILAADGTSGDPTEIALLEAAVSLGEPVDAHARRRARRAEFPFDASLKLMTTLDDRDGALWVDTKGAPEAVLARCRALALDGRAARPLDPKTRQEIGEHVDRYAADGLRVMACATRRLAPHATVESDRSDVERDLLLLGLVAMLDPPRPEVADAVARCHRAGIRVLVVTGDHPLTAAAIARRIGVSTDRVVRGEELDRLSEAELDELLRTDGEIVFARTSPEAKLRIADALRAEDHVVAMTGDGVNDAPALRRADIGIAMGRSGTDVAREASTMVLTDDNFATIVAAVEAGRRVYANVRKFIFYIFAHATPEVTPFLVYALARGSVPLPLTVLQLLAFDVGTETLPALALGREPAEPGVMRQAPRSRHEAVIRPPMLLRAWLFVGLIAAALQMSSYFYVLLDAGWSPGAPVGPGAPLHHAYLQATTMTFLAMVVCQIGTAFAARTERASLRSVGPLSNRMLLWGIAFELALAATVIYWPPLQNLLDTAALPPRLLVIVLPFPFLVWGADEFRKYLVRRAHG
jgi:calcium-translocating P-type ATPase